MPCGCISSPCVGSRVLGRGRTLVVGPGPTTADDIAGEPLSGRDGVLLRGIMADAGFAPDDWCYASAMSCVDKPTTELIAAQLNRLKGVLTDVNPVTVVLLGAVALRALCKREGLKSLRGDSLPLHPDFVCGTEAFPSYDPGYVLRTPNARPTVVADLRRVRDRVKEDEPVEYTRDLYPGLVAGGWVSRSPVAIDIETDYFETGGSSLVQLAYHADGLPTIVSGSPPACIEANPIITHNGWGFDIPLLRRSGCRIEGLGDDTMVLAYLDDQSQPRGLEALCVKYLGVKGWKAGITAPIGSDLFAEYNARDAAYTYRLWSVLTDRLGGRKRIADSVMRPAHDAFRACSERGLYIIQSAAESFEREMEATQTRFRSLLPVENPNSTQQVAQWLFGDKKHSTDIMALTKLGTPEAKAVLDYRHPGKMLSTFIRPYKELGRIHFEYNILGTDTGRVTARHHNMPRELKSMFGAPNGGCLLSVDYSAIEFRLAVWLAGVTDVLARFQADPSFDPHRWFAARFYGVAEQAVTKAQRQIAKSANFGRLYKNSPQGMREYAYKTAGVVMNMTQSRTLCDGWLAAMPQIEPWWNATERFLKENGYAESATGRRRHFGDPDLLPRGGAFNEMVRAAINHRVQSLATDVAQTGLILCWRAGLPVNGFFHDSVTFEFDSKAEAEANEDLIRHLMTTATVERLRDRFDVDITIPLAVEATYS